MLKQIIALWKGESFMKQVVEEFGEMLLDAEYIFTRAWEAVIGHAVIEEVKDPLYKKDININKRERNIRRKVLEHLSINPQQDVSGCLAMMSLVKDAERIGDYAKNLFDISVMIGGSMKGMKYAQDFSDIQCKIEKNFPKLREAFLNSDENLAKEILQTYKTIKEECNKIVDKLINDNLSTKESVATVLLSRYLKRINSHMNNIASGVVLPLDRIDFVRGGLLE